LVVGRKFFFIGSSCHFGVTGGLDLGMSDLSEDKAIMAKINKKLASESQPTHSMIK